MEIDDDCVLHSTKSIFIVITKHFNSHTKKKEKKMYAYVFDLLIEQTSVNLFFEK